MSDTETTVTLSRSASVALQELSSLTGQDAAEVLATAIERMADEERTFAAKIEAAREDVRAGRTVSHEEMMRRLEKTIAKAAGKEA